MNFKAISLKNKSYENADFIILFAFTKSHENLAKSLEFSVNRFNLCGVAAEIPEIHKSVSPRGTLNIEYSKPKIILDALKYYKKPILYIDSDCTLIKYPYLFHFLSGEKYDFGIFNWLSCDDNSAYIPLNLSDPKDHFFSHSIDFTSSSELICSGAVQYWGTRQVSVELLKLWLNTIQNNPNCADDHSLDYSYNNYSYKNELKKFWLPKSYVRYGWWIFDDPVINHQNIPYSGKDFDILVDFNGKPRINLDNISPKIISPSIFLQRNSKHTI